MKDDADAREADAMRRTSSTMRAAALALTGTLVAAVGLSRAGAVGTRHFTIDETDAFEAGELDGTMVLSSGELRRGLSLGRIEIPDTALAASLVRAPDGSTFVGTGSAGRIYRLRGQALSPFAETGQLLVASMALAPDGTLYAGTLPEGRVYRVDPRGAVSELVRLEETEHVWALAYDAGRRRLYAGTGPRGRIYRVSPAGEAELVFATEAAHVMSLALDADGTLYAGTDGEPRVLRISPEGRVSVVASLPGNEITALAVHDGTLAVVANEFPNPPRATAATKTLAPATDPSAQRPGPGKGRVFLVGADGRAERVLARDTGHFTSVAFTADGGLVVGGGREGRVFRVAPDRATATLAQVDERQVLAVDVEGERIVIATGDPAALYRSPGERGAPATWTSKVLDAGFRARWGRVSWRGDDRVEVQTRSGDTPHPDATWSSWSAVLRTPGPARSAASRFAQVRVGFSGDSDAVVRAIELYYLPQNQRAVVRDVGLTAPSGKNADAQRRPPAPSATLELSWNVDNPDGDALRYRLRFRREGRDRSLPLFGEDVVLTEKQFSWDTSSVPDGWYAVEVEASDELDNPHSYALRHAAWSAPLRVDNHAPAVEGLSVRDGRIVGQAVDSLGPIARLEISRDGGPFEDVFPEDGLLDSARESFALDLRQGTTDTHIVAIRATDAAGNTRTAELELPPRRP